MSNELDVKLEGCARRIEIGAKMTMEGILMAGQALAEAREMLPANQDFGKWRESRLPWLSKEMAWNFMNVHKNLMLNNLTTKVLDQLGPTISYLLAAPSTPAEVRDMAVTKTEAGEKVTVKEVQEWKKKHQEEERLRKKWEADYARLEKSSQIDYERLFTTEEQLRELERQFNSSRSEINRLNKELTSVQKEQKEVVYVKHERPPPGYENMEDYLRAQEAKITDLQIKIQNEEAALRILEDTYKARVTLGERSQACAKATLNLERLFAESLGEIRLLFLTEYNAGDLRKLLNSIDEIKTQLTAVINGDIETVPEN